MEQNINYDASTDQAFEDRSQIIIERNSEETVKVGSELVGKITAYRYNILIRDKAPLVGVLTREEVDLMHRLYSAEGANLSQRTVSRYFPKLTFQEFKKILRALNITKASSPMAPHMIEERTISDLVDLALQNKENDFLRKLEQDRSRLTELKLKELTKNYYELKQQIVDFKEFTESLNLNIEIDIKKPIYNTHKTLIVYLSDMHIGAEVSDYSIYNNTFNYEVAASRLQLVFDEIQKLALNMDCTNIVVCNIGDSLDGYNGETTRGGHKLPQNMNNKQQYEIYLKLMLTFFAELSSCGHFNTIRYYAVEGGNHDGDFGYMTNKSLEAALCAINPEIEVEIFDKYIKHFEIDGHTFILCHGKDATDVFKNMPLTINPKVENQISEYITYNKLYKASNIHFIKGDLHQSATTYAKNFRYKSVGSFFGSSEWIHKNFGNTPAVCDMDLIDGNSVFETRIVLN